MSRFHRGGGVALKPENALKRAEELIGVRINAYKHVMIELECALAGF